MSKQPKKQTRRKLGEEISKELYGLPLDEAMKKVLRPIKKLPKKK